MNRTDDITVHVTPTEDEGTFVAHVVGNTQYELPVTNPVGVGTQRKHFNPPPTNRLWGGGGKRKSQRKRKQQKSQRKRKQQKSQRKRKQQKSKRK